MPKPGTRKDSESQPVFGWIVIAFIGFVAAWMLGAFDGEQQRKPIDDTVIDQTIVDDKKQPDDPKPQPSGSLKDCVLLVVHDKKTTSESVEYTTTIQDDTFWDNAAKVVKDVEFLEDDDELGKKWLATAKATAPIVLLVNTSTKKLEWSMPLPMGTTEPIAKRLK